MRRAPLLGLIAVLLAPPACGYSLLGRGIVVDPTIKRVGVPLVKDHTGKAGLDEKITSKVSQELLKRTGYGVVQDSTGVDALLEVELLSYTVNPVGFSEEAARSTAATTATATTASRYSLVLTARVKYLKVGQTEPIWSSDSFTFRDEWDIGDASSYFDREDQALERLSTEFAKSLVATMLEAF
jgi:hypothetical protein